MKFPPRLYLSPFALEKIVELYVTKSTGGRETEFISIQEHEAILKEAVRKAKEDLFRIPLYKEHGTNKMFYCVGCTEIADPGGVVSVIMEPQDACVKCGAELKSQSAEGDE